MCVGRGMWRNEKAKGTDSCCSCRRSLCGVCNNSDLKIMKMAANSYTYYADTLVLVTYKLLHQEPGITPSTICASISGYLPQQDKYLVRLCSPFQRSARIGQNMG